MIDRLIQSTPAHEDELANDARFQSDFCILRRFSRIGRLELRARHVVEGFIERDASQPVLRPIDRVPAASPVRRRATICATSTGRSGPRPTACTSSSSRKTPTCAARWSSTFRRAWSTAAGRSISMSTRPPAAVSSAYLLLRQHDAVGCMAFDEKTRADADAQHVGPSRVDRADARRQPRRRRRPIRATCCAADRGGELPPRVDRRGLRSAGRRGVDPPRPATAGGSGDTMSSCFTSWMTTNSTFRSTGRRGSKGWSCRRTSTATPRRCREGYLAAVEKFVSSLRHGCARDAVDYELIRTSQLMDAALAAFLSRRLARSQVDGFDQWISPNQRPIPQRPFRPRRSRRLRGYRPRLNGLLGNVIHLQS